MGNAENARVANANIIEKLCQNQPKFGNNWQQVKRATASLGKPL